LSINWIILQVPMMLNNSPYINEPVSVFGILPYRNIPTLAFYIELRNTSTITIASG